MLRIWSPIHTAVLHLFLYIRSSNTEKGVDCTMKRPLYRLGVMLLALVLVLALPVTSFAATANEWDTSKSKTATNLDGNYISNITLSLPSAQETLETDVVFVLDKSTSDTVENQALKMLESLTAQVTSTGAKVNVGVVIFNREAHRVCELTALTAESLPNIENAIKTNISSGTNTHAGMLAGAAMLDEDTDVSPNRKYLIFVSDMLTYLFDDNNTVTSITTEQFFNEASAVKSAKSNEMAGVSMKYPNGSNIFEGTTVANYLEKIASFINNDGKKYWVPYLTTNANEVTVTLKSNINEIGVKTLDDEEFAKYVGDDSVFNHANNLDVALYKTYEVFKSCVDKNYHCYALMADTSSYDPSKYPWVPQYIAYLAEISGNGSVDFDDIQNDIYYLLDRGSFVVDYMGYTDDYNFDFVNEASEITLKVGDTNYVVDQAPNPPEVETSHYYFINPNSLQNDGFNPDFELIYDKGNGTTEEHFTWKINVPVSNFAPVQLTYSVKLVNPKTEPGTYGTYDEDGSKGYTELYTNNSATLYPIDTNGDKGASEDFNKPTVSYTISAPETQTPVPTYPVYYPDYSEEPAATPTPTPFVPSDETSPKTGAGDAALPALLIVALAAAGVAVVSMRKRAR